MGALVRQLKPASKGGAGEQLKGTFSHSSYRDMLLLKMNNHNGAAGTASNDSATVTSSQHRKSIDCGVSQPAGGGHHPNNQPNVIAAQLKQRIGS